MKQSTAENNSDVDMLMMFRLSVNGEHFVLWYCKYVLILVCHYGTKSLLIKEKMTIEEYIYQNIWSGRFENLLY